MSQPIIELRGLTKRFEGADSVLALDHIDLTVEQAEKYIEEGHFAAGSMLPKVQAAVDFASSGPDRTAMITHLNKARDGIMGKTGTRIHL